MVGAIDLNCGLGNIVATANRNTIAQSYFDELGSMFSETCSVQLRA